MYDSGNAGGVNAGDVGQSDRGLISAAGSVSNDQDRFNFTVSTPAVVNDTTDLSTDVEEVPESIDNVLDRVSVSIDVDYADANTTAYLFNGNRLIAIGTDSNILDDVTVPVLPIDETDLSRGSDSLNDPFIGPIELNSNGNYRVYVSANNEVASVLDQFTDPDSTNTLVRLEPVDTQNRFVDERFSAQRVDQLPQSLAPSIQDRAATRVWDGRREYSPVALGRHSAVGRRRQRAQLVQRLHRTTRRPTVPGDQRQPGRPGQSHP